MAARKLQSKPTGPTLAPSPSSALLASLLAFPRRFEGGGKQLGAHKRLVDECSLGSCFQRCSSVAQTSSRGDVVAPPLNAAGTSWKEAATSRAGVKSS